MTMHHTKFGYNDQTRSRILMPCQLHRVTSGCITKPAQVDITPTRSISRYATGKVGVGISLQKVMNLVLVGICCTSRGNGHWKCNPVPKCGLISSELLSFECVFELCQISSRPPAGKATMKSAAFLIFKVAGNSIKLYIIGFRYIFACFFSFLLLVSIFTVFYCFANEVLQIPFDKKVAAF